MSGRKVLFIDRDGTLIVEPPDQQIDSLAKLQLMHDVIPALRQLRDAGYAFVMVSNQDGLGTASLSRTSFCARCSHRKASDSRRSSSVRTSLPRAAPAGNPRPAWSMSTYERIRSTGRRAT